MKLTRFRDIPPFVRDGAYEVDIPFDSILEWIERGQTEQPPMSRLDIDPDFQRVHVWKPKQQTAWLEYWLRGGRTGRVIYFNHPGWMRGYQGDFVLVDGKQRLEAVRAFQHNEIKVFGSHFKEYTDKCSFTQATLKFNVNTLKTRREVLSWYIQFNAGGTPHTRKEIDRVIELYKAEVEK